MFRHQIKIQLKTESFTRLSRIIENTIMPLLRGQKGFCQGVTFISPERSTATEDTFWNTREDAEEYQKSGYLKVLENLSEVIIASPQALISEVSN